MILQYEYMYIYISGAKCGLYQAEVQPLHRRERRLERGQGEVICTHGALLLCP